MGRNRTGSIDDITSWGENCVGTDHWLYHHPTEGLHYPEVVTAKQILEFPDKYIAYYYENWNERTVIFFSRTLPNSLKGPLYQTVSEIRDYADFCQDILIEIIDKGVQLIA